MRATIGVDQQLAIDGGEPVRTTLLPYGRHSIDSDDIRAVVEVLRSDRITCGPVVDRFETALADVTGAAYAVSFSSGTAALHAAMFAAGVGIGDEVITSPMTFCATANVALHQGATPVFADVSGDTLNLNPEEVLARITPKTKALLPVDYAGHPADLQPLLDIAHDRDLIVVEDACHALGAEYRNRCVGSISHMTAFSFHPVKHIACGEGGVVTTNDASLAEKLRRFRGHGIDGDARACHPDGAWYYEMIELGFNYRLSDIACALGCAQLAELPANLARRRQIVRMYEEALSNTSAIRLPAERSDARSAWHLYPLRLDLDCLRADRATIVRALRAEQIGASVHYIPVPYHPYYRTRFGDPDGRYPEAEAAYRELVTVPLFPAMSDQDVQDVVDGVTKVLSHYERET